MSLFLHHHAFILVDRIFFRGVRFYPIRSLYFLFPSVGHRGAYRLLVGSVFARLNPSITPNRFFLFPRYFESFSRTGRPSVKVVNLGFSGLGARAGFGFSVIIWDAPASVVGGCYGRRQRELEFFFVY